MKNQFYGFSHRIDTVESDINNRVDLISNFRLDGLFRFYQRLSINFPMSFEEKKNLTASLIKELEILCNSYYAIQDISFDNSIYDDVYGGNFDTTEHLLINLESIVMKMNNYFLILRALHLLIDYIKEDDMDINDIKSSFDQDINNLISSKEKITKLDINRQGFYLYKDDKLSYYRNYLDIDNIDLNLTKGQIDFIKFCWNQGSFGGKWFTNLYSQNEIAAQDLKTSVSTEPFLLIKVDKNGEIYLEQQGFYNFFDSDGVIHMHSLISIAVNITDLEEFIPCLNQGNLYVEIRNTIINRETFFPSVNLGNLSNDTNEYIDSFFLYNKKSKVI